jgi:mannosyl-oligosaccharide alpha-1,2-mannosidase
MLRFRRYRVFLIFAILLTIVFVRLSRTRQWRNDGPDFSDLPSNWKDYTKESYDQFRGSSSPQGEAKPKTEIQSPTVVDVEKLGHSSVPESNSIVQDVSSPVQPTIPEVKPPTKTSSSPLQISSTAKFAIETLIPDRPLVPPPKSKVAETTEIHPLPPSRVEPVTFSSTPSTIHWKKQKEHFPVPTQSIIQLPTGNPPSIPRIQHVFSDETPIAKSKRLERLGKVKSEFKRAWAGYKEHAWMHDELRPVSGKFRDPFCGWAATLVDSLDTLWIMDLEEDFEEAVKAVGKIDFTTSMRADIPVFETTIRYLGGLIAAYDISGGTHRVLLDKAVELAEVLMGAFDTPNRMPVLFYRWVPDFASQPHRASTRANLAELGSLSVEFTRLAQLTKDAKYYDAVARITDALEEFQNRGTGLPGVFPDNVDASGCNRSIPIVNTNLPTVAAPRYSPLPADLKGYQAPMPDPVDEPVPQRWRNGEDADNLEVSIIPGQPGKARIQVVDVEAGKPETNSPKIGKRDEAKQPGKARIKVVDVEAGEPETSNNQDAMRDGSRQPGKAQIQVVDVEAAKPETSYDNKANRDQSSTEVSNTTLTSQMPSTSNKDAQFKQHLDVKTQGRYSEHALGEWDCVSQGLTSSNIGRDSFSMGGGQDSTYEYFTKVIHLSSFHKPNADIFSNTYFSAVLNLSIVICT